MKLIQNRFLFIAIGLCLSLTAFAQSNPVSWTFTSEFVGNDEFNLIATANIEDGWYTYSQEAADDGPVPTSFEFFDGAHYELVGDAKETGNRKAAPEPAFGGITVIKFSKKGIFTQKVKVSDASKPIEGYVNYMTCDGEMCLPPKDVDFNFTLEVPKNIAVEAIAEEEVKEEVVIEEKPLDVIKEEVVVNTPIVVASKVIEVEEKVAPRPKPSPKNATSTPTKPKTSAPKFAEVETSVAPPKRTFANDGKATDAEPVVWDFQSEKISDTKYRLVFHADIAEHWALYSPFIGDDAGPIPTTFEITPSDFFTTSGRLLESANVETKFDKVFGTEISKFHDYATFAQIVDVTGANGKIDGYVTFMTCNDENCLPPKDVDFSFNIGGSEAAVAPVASTDLGPGGKGTFDSKRDIDSETYLADCGDSAPVEDNKSMWTIFILGFLGGLVALLTPCVFPMIPLTVSFFTGAGSDKANGIKKAIIYGISIIVIYVVAGIALTSFFGPTVLNEMAVNPYFNLVFFALLVIFAFSFFGYFELTLPSSWVNSTDKAADKGGLLGIFFMAGTLALVSFSCTGPIIGTLLVETVSDIQPGDIAFGFIPKRPFIGMFGFALALALPFTLFAAFPAWLNSLPKSGSWMTGVKVTLGFLELALAFKFLSTADLTGEWGFLKYELFVGIWILIFLLLALWYFGILKFPHDGPTTNLSWGRKGLGAASLAFAIFLGTTFMGYQPLWILSGISPPINYSWWNKNDCPYGIDCYKDFDKGLAVAKAEGKPLFVDFTGHGCQNCRKMEDFVWKEEKILSKLRDDYVVVSLYVDDRARLFPEDKRAYLLDVHSGEKLRTVGSKWASFEISNFNKSSQPYYVLMDNDGKTLLNKPVAYTPDIDTYDAFLECGLSAFRKLSMR